MQTFELKFSGVTILEGVEFPIFLLIPAWALQQCRATALPVIVVIVMLYDAVRCTTADSSLCNIVETARGSRLLGGYRCSLVVELGR